MRIRLFTIAACSLLVVCLATWARSYLPGELHLRAEKGSLCVLYMHPQWARDMEQPTFIDTLRSSKTGGWRFMGFEVIRNQPLEWGFVALDVPFWAVCLPLVGTAAWGVLAWRRQRERERPGACHKCGYDLHASPDRCPECGTPVPHREEATA